MKAFLEGGDGGGEGGLVFGGGRGGEGVEDLAMGICCFEKGAEAGGLFFLVGVHNEGSEPVRRSCMLIATDLISE